MEAKKPSFSTIDEYLSKEDLSNRERLVQMRDLIREEAPNATEKISWGMPTFYLNGNLVHFFGNKNHLGFYPGESGVARFQDELKDYKTSKGAIQLPYSRPLPVELIRRIVRFRVEENMRKTNHTSKNSLS